MGVIAGGPKGNHELWIQVNKWLLGAMVRLYRNGDFSDLGEGESRVHFGIGYGEEYAVCGFLAHLMNAAILISIPVAPPDRKFPSQSSRDLRDRNQ
jgi:hypothetical protein